MATDRQLRAAVTAWQDAQANGFAEYGAMRRALESAERAAWEPIETAPPAHEDPNRTVLVCGGIPPVVREVFTDGEFWRSEGKPLRATPTHWREKPAPPTDSEDEA